MERLKIVVDAARFPMVYIEPIQKYIHWLPVTKIQLEYFLCSTTDPEYNDTWYQQVLGFNPRISPGTVNANNYWQALLTGVMPHTARNYAKWCGRDFNLLVAHEWYTAYDYLRTIDENERYIDQILEHEKIRPRTKALIQNIEHSTQQVAMQLDGRRTLADQMLMRLGVMEFVYQNDNKNSYAGYGQTNSNFFPSLDRPTAGYPQQLNDPKLGTAMGHYGFRLAKGNIS
jgi:hypothetical protein